MANGLGILKAVRLTKRVRVLLVIGSGDMQQRCQGLKKLANTLGQILPNLSKHLKSQGGESGQARQGCEVLFFILYQ